MIPVAVIGASAAYFLQTEGQKIVGLEDRITALQQQLKKVKTENSDLLAENNRLKLPPVPAPEPERTHRQSLTERQYNLLMIIAECESESEITTSSNLLQASRLQKVVMNSTLDDLMGFGYVIKIKIGFDNKYMLTAAGRKFVVSEEQA